MNQKKSPPQNSKRGFTLVELSIVLVIIGLIIGGVLTGQQVIQNARVTKAVQDIQAYQAQFHTYQQNYSAIAGDDAGAATRFTVAGIVNGNGGQTIDGQFDSTSCGGATSSESCYVWGDLRAANLVKNQSPVNGQPSNPFSGIYGFQNGAFTGTGAFTTTVLCLSNVPGAAALALDTRLDDGVPSTGSIEASSAGTAGAGGALPAAGATYDSSLTYTMCVKL